MKQLKTLAVLAALLLVNQAHAACSIGTTGMHFATYSDADNAPSQGFGNVKVTCTSEIGGALTNLSNGGNLMVSLSSGNSNNYQRYMTNYKNEKLFYNIYLNPNNATVFGDGTFGTQKVLLSVGSGQTKDMTIYGNIPTHQNVSAGDFFETMIITLTP